MFPFRCIHIFRQLVVQNSLMISCSLSTPIHLLQEKEPFADQTDKHLWLQEQPFFQHGQVVYLGFHVLLLS